MIFEALQSELFRFKFHSLGSKILKFPEFNLVMIHNDFLKSMMVLVKSMRIEFQSIDSPSFLYNDFSHISNDSENLLRLISVFLKILSSLFGRETIKGIEGIPFGKDLKNRECCQFL